MDRQTSSGMNRLRALLEWWGLSGYGDRNSFAAQFVRLQNFVAETQKAYLDATGRHMDAIFASNDRLARTAYDLLSGGKQFELSQAQAQIVSAILDSAAQHARTWMEFHRQVQEIYSATARPQADKADAASGSATTRVKDEQRADQSAAEKLVDAA